MFIFYAIRGLFLLLSDALKGLQAKPSKPARRVSVAPSAQDSSVQTPVVESASADAPPDTTDRTTPSPEAKAPSTETTVKRITIPNALTEKTRKSATPRRRTARRGIRLKDDAPPDDST
ncbi:MAG: hypothetical protein ACUVT0_00305 [Thermochromatium sp.]